MAVKVIELHHHAVRVPKAKADGVARFYIDVLGLQPDAKRPEIPSVPGSWMYVGPEDGPTTQIHIMGSDGLSGIARSEQQDPTRFHVAFAVDDIEAAQKELDRASTPYWVFGGVVGPNSVQIFLEDPAGNMIELHQIGTCNCNRIALTPEGSTA